MKMLLLNYYIGIHHEVMEVIERAGVCTYTRWREVEGRISCGDPRESSHVWPGANSTLMVVVEDAAVDGLLGEFEAMNRGRMDEGVDAYVLNVEKVQRAA